MRLIARFVVLMIVTAGCAYEPKETFFKSIKQPTGDGASITLITPAGKITVIEPTVFRVDLKSPGGKSLAYEATVAGRLLKKGEIASGAIDIPFDPAGLNSGQYNLHIAIVFPSGSGSISDGLGLEFFKMEKDIPFTLNLSAPGGGSTLIIPPPTVTIQDGKSLITMDVPTESNILRRLIIREYLENNVVVQRDTLAVNVPSKSTQHDDTYIGGKVSYYILVLGYKFSVKSVPTIFEVSPGFDVVYDSTVNPPLFKWKKPTLYGNSLQITITMGQNPPRPYPVSFDANYEIGHDPVLNFGRSASYEIKFAARVETEFPRSIVKTMVGHPGLRVPTHQLVRYVPQQNAYFLVSDNKFIKLNPTDFQVSASVAFDSPSSGEASESTVSNDGAFAYLQKNQDLSKVVKVRLSDLAIVGTIDLAPFATLPYANFRQTLAFVAGSILIFETNSAQYLLDLNLNQVIKTFSFQKNSFSSDGEFMGSFNTVYKRNGNNWDILVGTVPLPIFFNNMRLSFRKNGAINEVVVWNAAPAKFYNLDAPTDGAGVLSGRASNGGYDPVNDVLMQSSTPGTYDIYNASSLAFIKSIITSDGSPVFVNGHFFHPAGYVSFP